MVVEHGTHIGPYRLTSRIGSSRAFLAQDERGRGVVVKLHARGEEEAAGLAEAALLGIRHLGLSAFLDAGRHPDERSLYTVTEAVSGGPLCSAAWSARPRSPDDVPLLCHRLLSALAVVHEQGLLHRDLKPDNVFVDDQGQPVILDFGLSCPVAEAAQRALGGTPRAMAPELFRGRPASIVSDLWAAGLLLSEALLGRSLFVAETPAEMLLEREAFQRFTVQDGAQLGDRALVSLLGRLLAPDPALRPPDARAALAALPRLAHQPAAEEARNGLLAKLSIALARNDARRQARLVALADRRLWIGELAQPSAELDEVLQGVLALARQVQAPDAGLRARIAAAEFSGRPRPSDFAGLIEGLAARGAIVLDLGCTRAESQQSQLGEEVARLLAGVRGVEIWREPGLTPATTAQVLERWLGDCPVIAERLRDVRLESVAALEQALAALVHQGVVREGAGGLAIDEACLPADWPLTGRAVQALQLSPPAEELLGVLASCSRPLEPSLCEEALQRPVQLAVEQLLEAGLASRQRAHPLDRLEITDPDIRRSVQAPSIGVRTRLAMALARWDAGDSRGLAESVAIAIGELIDGDVPTVPDDEDLLNLVVKAAETLRRTGRLQRAVKLLERGVRGARAGSERLLRLHHDRVDVLVRGSLHERALAAVAEARRDLGSDPGLALREARILQLRGRAREALAVLEPLNPEILSREDGLLALQVRAMVRQALGDLQGALQDARDGLRRAGAGDDRRAMALLERTASIEEKLGHFDEAARHYEACIAMARRLGQEALIGSPLYNMGRALRQRGEKRRGLQLQEEGARRMEAAGDLVGLAAALNGLGAGCLLLGRVDDARQNLQRALNLAERLDDQALAGMVLNNLARALAAEGRLAEAEEHFAQSMRLRAGRGDRRGQAAVALTRGRIQMQRGRLEEAQRDLRLGREFLEGLEAPEWLVELSLLEAGLALAVDDAPTAVAAGERAGGLAGRHAFRSEQLRALDLLARAGQDSLASLEIEREERGPWLADLLFTRAARRAAAGGTAEADADVALALSILGETPDGVVEARGLLLGLQADLQRLRESLSSPTPDYGKVGELLARLSRDEARARSLVETHDLNPFRAPLLEAARELAAVGEAEDMSGLAGLAERLRSLERLAEINKLLNSEHETQRLLNLIVDSAIDLTGAARGFLILFDGRAEEFRAARNIDESTIHNPEFEVSHSVARRVAKDGRALLTANAIDDPRLSTAASISQLKLLSILCVPLISRERTLGAIYLDHPQVVGRFDERHLGTVTALAEQAAIALQNARLSEGLAQTNRELRASREEVARLNEALQARLVEREAELETVRESLDASRRALALRYDYSAIVTCSPKMHAVLDLMDRITDTDFPVIIQGESGTGKELIARAIHFNGPRRERNFLSLNCAAIAEPLIESELFGSMRGAFTGADRDRKGLFEQAHTGSLFLDEIGDMSPSVQKRLLRVLQEGEFLPVGGREVRRVDVRILCATHRDLRKMVAEGAFREDLYYRLAVAQIRVPPLRERAEDLALLLPHFLGRHGSGVRRIDPEALSLLRRQSWPGNVRELENFVMNLLLLDREGKQVTASLVQRLIASAQHASSAPIEGFHPSGPTGEAVEGGLKQQLEAFERKQVQAAMLAAEGNKARAAELLGVSVRTLYKMLERLGL
ncbi:MAG: sigma 54-interacting transcriptional regulator [Planctomycetota bacterium]